MSGPGLKTPSWSLGGAGGESERAMSAAEKVEAEGSTSCPSAEHGEDVDGRRDAAEDGCGVADDATGEGEGGGEREGVPIEELGQLLLSEGGSVEEDGVTDHDGPGSAIVSKEGDDGDDGASQSEEGFALPRPPSVPGLGDEEAESVPTAAADGPDLCGVVGEVASLVPADTLAGIMRLQQNV